MALDTTLIHDTLFNYCHEYIPVQEITHAANQICLNPTEDTILEMTTYLDQFDKEFIPLQTINIKPITTNQVRYAMAEIRKIVATAQETPEPDVNEEGGND